MRVLITNCWLDGRTGTELYVRDLALGLLREGHQPMVYSPRHGEVVEELRQAGVRVSDDLSERLPTPDVVHGHHTLETLAALTRFPSTPGVYVQHDASVWMDEPLHHPRLLRHLAVDELCRERLVASGIDAARTEVVPNGVDVLRFGRRPLLPAAPARALVLTNSEPGHFLEAIRSGCAARGVQLDVLGWAGGRPVVPEDVLGEYDVVFAKARTALEALAVGCAVVVCDRAGMAGMLTSQVQDEWRRWNFGRRLLSQRHTAEAVVAELDRYDAADAGRCTDRARSEYTLQGVVQRLLEVYEGVVKEHDPAADDHAAELVDLSHRVARLGPLRVTENAYLDLQPAAASLEAEVAHLRGERAGWAEHRASLEEAITRLELERAGIADERLDLAQARDRLQHELDSAAAEREVLEARLAELEAELEGERRGLAGAHAEAAAVRERLAAVEGTLTFRARGAALRSPFGRALVRLLRRDRRR